jgi:hypothetical protein
MSSSWPILLGFIVIVVAAFWYDATVAPPGHLSEAPAPTTQAR